MIGVLSFQYLAGTQSAFSTMMPVGNVDRRDLAECGNDRVRIFRLPDRLSNAFFTFEIVKRRTRNFVGNELADRIGPAVSQKDQARLGSEGDHVVGAVLDLVGTRFFVAFDLAACVFIERTAGDDAGLRVAASVEPV